MVASDPRVFFDLQFAYIYIFMFGERKQGFPSGTKENLRTKKESAIKMKGLAVAVLKRFPFTTLCVCACVRACGACVRACVRACVCVCVRAFVRV